MNQVQFTHHAVERVLGRFSNITSYSTIQTVLLEKPMRNGKQKVVVASLPHMVTILDETARNGKVTGKTVKAVVETKNNNEVEVITVVLE